VTNARKQAFPFSSNSGGVHKSKTGRKLDGKTYNEFPHRLVLPVMETRRRLAAIAEISALSSSPQIERELDLFSLQ
jgi:hypothetical protein